MPADPFRLLRAMAEHAEVFAAGSAAAEAAVTSIFTAAVKASDKARLAAIGGAVGAEAFDALSSALRPADVRATVDRIEGPTRPARTSAAALASLSRIARGIAAQPEFDLAALDLAGLREAWKALGSGFDAWLTRQGAKAKPALQAMDPHFTKVSTVTPARARPRLAELAGGAEPTPATPAPAAAPAFRLADLDVDGIRRVRAELGDGFEPWLKSQKGPDLKAALVRLDPIRPNVKKLPKDHYPFLLNEIASGGSLFTRDEDAPPIGEERFSMRKG